MVIRMRNVSFSREGRWILKNVDWSVKQGEHWAMVGLNGSGKTTLLNIVNGYLWPTRGDVTVLGKDFGSLDLRELRKSIGWVSSSLQDQLYGYDTALKIVLSGRFASIGLYEKPTKEDIEQGEHLLEIMGCASSSSRPYKLLSQGEKQKVLIVRGLMNDPALLILDEPCSGLDVLSREQLLKKIDEIGRREEGPTIIFVTHRVEEIIPVFSNTLLLKEGETFAADKTREVLTGSNLTACFQVPVDVTWQEGRAWLQVAGGFGNKRT